jgi:hypothetical protein
METLGCTDKVCQQTRLPESNEERIFPLETQGLWQHSSKSLFYDSTLFVPISFCDSGFFF